MEQLELLSPEAEALTDSGKIITEGIKYAGSKREIIPSIIELAKKLEVKTVFDGFAGTTRVSQALAQNGFRVWCNDLAEWSYIFGICYLKNRTPRSKLQKKIDHLNSLKGRAGWFTENYGGSGQAKESDLEDGKKKVWQRHNTAKLDVIRPEIDKIAESPSERAVLLTSLILAMDKVDSTVGHHTSYLREWAPRSFNTMHMKMPLLLKNTRKDHIVSKADIFSALKANLLDVDLAYFDPPYGSSNEKMPPSRVRYASYYHLWTTIIKNDQPELVGAANRRADVSDKIAGSVFEEFRRNEKGRFIAVDSIDRLIQKTKAKYIILSYSNQGRATLDELLDVCHSNGDDVFIVERDHKSNVMKTMRWTNKWINEQEEQTKEFLFVISMDGKLRGL